MPLNDNTQRSNGASDKSAFLPLPLSLLNEQLPQFAVNLPKTEQDLKLTPSKQSKVLTFPLRVSAEVPDT